MESFFRTTKIPTTHIYRNHLDRISHTIDGFCHKNKNYEWFISDEINAKVVKSIKLATHLNTHQPQIIKYYVTHKGNEVIRVDIDNGVTINITNGGYLSYGLFHDLVDIFSEFQMPSLIVFIRRYWVINIPVLLWLSVLLLALAGATPWSIGVGILAGLVTFTIGAYAIDNLDNESELAAMILNTKINHDKYSNRLGVPIYAALSSTSTIFTALASLATIISTVVLFTR